MKKLTVIVLSYNFEKWIEKCLSSIVEQQTNFDFDIFIGDDNSTDSTRTVIMNFVNNQSDVSKFKLFFREENIGAHKNIELLIKNCESQYISYIDGDDYFTDTYKLQKQVDFLDQNPEFIIHSTSYFYHNQDDTITPQGWWYGPVKNVCEIEDISHINYILFGRTFRNLFTEFDKLWSDPNWREFYYADWFFNFFLMKYGKSFSPNDYPSGNYRITGLGQMTKLPDEKKREIEVECQGILYVEYQKFLAENEST